MQRDNPKGEERKRRFMERLQSTLDATKGRVLTPSTQLTRPREAGLPQPRSASETPPERSPEKSFVNSSRSSPTWSQPRLSEYTRTKPVSATPSPVWSKTKTS